MAFAVWRRIRPNPEDAAVPPLELFFDLVFVFALTQVTAMMAHHLDGMSIVRGLLVLCLLWWSWTGYAWLCNVVRSDSGPVSVVLLLAMASMLVLALAIPEAFVDLPGGLHGPVVVAVCYFFFRLMHLAIFWLVADGDPKLRRQLVRFAPSMLGGTTLLLVAAGLHGTAQTLVWVAALVADYVGTLLGGSSGWVLASPSHFAERHGLILIVALGESIVAIGVGVTGLPIDVPIVAASVLGLLVAGALWWAYFDVTAHLAEVAFRNEPVVTRARFARDAYSYLHLPLVAGIVLTALGMKKVLEYVGDETHHGLTDPLAGWAAVALVGGPLLYLLAHVAFKYRTLHQVVPSRLVGAVLLAALLPLALNLPAIATLALVAVLLVALMAFETVAHSEERAALHEAHDRHHA